MCAILRHYPPHIINVIFKRETRSGPGPGRRPCPTQWSVSFGTTTIQDYCALVRKECMCIWRAPAREQLANVMNVMTVQARRCKWSMRTIRANCTALYGAPMHECTARHRPCNMFQQSGRRRRRRRFVLYSARVVCAPACVAPLPPMKICVYYFILVRSDLLRNKWQRCHRRQRPTPNDGHDGSRLGGVEK